MTLMPVSPSVEYKSTVCCATKLVPGLVVRSAISGAISSELDSRPVDFWRLKTRLNIVEPSLFDILGIRLEARDYLVQIVE